MPRPRHSVAQLADGIRRGEVAALSQGITLVESRLAADRAAAEALLERLLPHTGGAFRVGITGSPGAGKSTFIEAFGLHLIAQGHRLAVLAVDPSSPRSGGSILGDKTRMEALARSPQSFIRPSPSGGAVGGVGRSSREALLLCEAAGFDVVIVETVGVGQSETVVRGMVDAFVLLQLPGAGDSLQGIKRGVMEMADLVVVTKADGEGLTRARLAQADLHLALHLYPPPESGVAVGVLLTSALEGQGIAQVWQALGDYRAATQHSGFWADQRRRQQQAWFDEEVREGLWQRLEASPSATQHIAQLRADIAQGRLTPPAAAQALLRQWLGSSD